MNQPTIYSLVYLAAFLAYFCFGSYVLFLNMNSRTNRVFGLACLSLCVWTLAYSIVISAPDYQTALAWRRLSVLGWGTFHSIFVHLCLSITEKNQVLAKRWVYLLIYGPAVLILYVFGANPQTASVQHVLVRTKAGWVNAFANNFWDWFFNAYFVICDVCAIGLVWLWGNRARIGAEKAQSRILFNSFVLVFVLGSVSDVFLNAYSPFKVPQLASVFIMIAMAAVLYCIRRYGLMLPDVRRTAETGRILSEVRRRQIYLLLAVTLAVAGVINFLLYVKISADQARSVALAFMLFGASFSVIFLASPAFRPVVQETALAVILGVFVFAMIDLTKNINGSDITWVFPVLLMIVSSVFTKKRVLIALAVAGLFAESWFWVKLPVQEVTIGYPEHIARILVYGVAGIFALAVNLIYTERLKENENQLHFQGVTSRVSQSLAAADKESFDDRIRETLSELGKLYQAEKASFLLFADDLRSSPLVYQWCAGYPVPPGSQDDKEASYQRWLMDRLRDRKRLLTVYDAVTDCELSINIGANPSRNPDVKSVLAVSWDVGDRVPQGCLEIRARSGSIRWLPHHLDTLQIIANNLVHAWKRVEWERKVHSLAYYDPLTGLPNRFLMRDLLGRAVADAQKKGKSLGVILVDLHSFKEINETIGHEAGDVLLRKMAQRLRECTSQSDTVCRFGGDEFAVIVSSASDRDALGRTTEEIIRAMSEPVTTDSQEFFVNANAGIAVYPWDGETPDDLLKNVDLAVNASKAKGVNQYEFYSPEMSREIEQKTMLINGLYRALEKDEFVLHYQPQVDITSGSIIGVEALIRWNHPVLGMVSPSVFIPLAEQSGLIHAIGEWVLRTACCQNQSWQEKGLPSIKVAVNLSPEQFKNPNLVTVVENVLKDTGMPPQYLELEITESVAAKDAKMVLESLNQLKQLGISIAIDDFGSEYSSLGRLRSMPVDRIKIGMHLVHHLTAASKDEAITKAILYLAKSLGIRVVAEGVETREQLEILTSWSCKEVQGFYYFRPMPADQVEELLIKDNI